jgi:2-keto-3-deoxy-L-rhamnonate aldolase RhmA
VGLKNMIVKKQTTIGSWITIGDPIVAEVMAGAGFDWLTVDMEHSAITIKEAQDLIRVISLSGVVPFVRVGENNAGMIKRVMDAGAYGVIVPMVNSKEDAEKAVASVKYPPLGNRGVGLARAHSYGFTFADYKKWNENESVVIAHIEHIEAIENLEDILDTEGIDGTIIGPYDLSGSLGHPGELDHPEVKKALEKYEAVCAKKNMPKGSHVIPPNAKELKKKIEKGYTFLAWSLDTLFLGTACREGMKNIKGELA